VLLKVILCSQNACFPGRLIIDNILVAYETLHTMHSRLYEMKGYMAIKLDMSKANDRVEWVFLEAVLVRMGFDGRWINLMRMCYNTIHYSILMNGNPIGRVQPTRGLR
jgi:hypothetical protein